MSHYGTLRDYRFADKDPDDIRGASVYGNDDDKLGKIDDVVFDHSTGDIRYLVVDTGGWLSSKKFLVPPESLSESSKHDGDYNVNMTKEQIESFPPYDEKDLESDDRWKDYESRYRSKWVNDPVMHRAETDRNITPTTAQMTQGSGATGPSNWEAKQQQTPAPTAASHTTSMGHGSGSVGSSGSTERIIPATANEVTIPMSGAGIGDRYSTFESRLRQRRRDITHSCTTCSIGSASDREESVADQRKAV